MVGGREKEFRPYVIGDAAYPISSWLIKGYTGNRARQEKRCAYFTYRLSSARMKVEQAFGILKVKWERLAGKHKGMMRHHVEAAGAACVLHNLCIDKKSPSGLPDDSALLQPEVISQDQVNEIRESHGPYFVQQPDGGEVHVKTPRSIKEDGEKTRDVLADLLELDPRYDRWQFTEPLGI